MHLAKNNYFEAKGGEDKQWGEELVYEKFLSVELILSQIFTQIEFSWVAYFHKNMDTLNLTYWWI